MSKLPSVVYQIRTMIILYQVSTNLLNNYTVGHAGIIYYTRNRVSLVEDYCILICANEGLDLSVKTECSQNKEIIRSNVDANFLIEKNMTCSRKVLENTVTREFLLHP